MILFVRDDFRVVDVLQFDQLAAVRAFQAMRVVVSVVGHVALRLAAIPAALGVRGASLAASSCQEQYTEGRYNFRSTQFSFHRFASFHS
jgi:hypothetical protein